MNVLIVLVMLLATHMNASSRQHKVIICGVCRNIEKSIPYSMKIAEKIGALFKDYRIIVYENNSNDQTPHLMRQWAAKNQHVYAITEFLTDHELETTYINTFLNQSLKREYFPSERIARARNKVMDVATSSAYDGFDYIIWMDMDFCLEPDYGGIKEAFSTSIEWDAVFAYGIYQNGLYYDWYALRDKKYPLGPELLGVYWWDMPKGLTFSTRSPWYPVYSAFGGCAIYKKSSVMGCRYSGIVTKDLADLSRMILEKYKIHPLVKLYKSAITGLSKIVTIPRPSFDLQEDNNPSLGIFLSQTESDIIWRMGPHAFKYPCVCEHVTLHASMIAQGHDKLFINPRMKFRYI